MTFQPDIASIRQSRQARFKPFLNVQNRLRHKFKYPKIRYTPYKLDFTGNEPVQPFLLIPANPKRVAINIGSSLLPEQGPALFSFQLSFGYPVRINNPIIGDFLGLEMVVGSPSFVGGKAFQPVNGQISIDDIYISPTVTGQQPFSVIGYEGVLAIEGNTLS